MGTRNWIMNKWIDELADVIDHIHFLIPSRTIGTHASEYFLFCTGIISSLIKQFWDLNHVLAYYSTSCVHFFSFARSSSRSCTACMACQMARDRRLYLYERASSMFDPNANYFLAKLFWSGWWVLSFNAWYAWFGCYIHSILRLGASGICEYNNLLFLLLVINADAGA